VGVEKINFEEVTRMEKVLLWLNETSEPLEYENVENTYTKGNLFVIFFEHGGKRIYDKFPLANIWRIREIEEVR